MTVRVDVDETDVSDGTSIDLVALAPVGQAVDFTGRILPP